MAALPFRGDAAGVLLTVRLTPRADRTALTGVVEGADGRAAVGVRVASPPVEGAANAALIGYLAKALRLRQAAVTLRAGHTGRTKQVHLAGDPEAITAALRTWIAQG